MSCVTQRDTAPMLRDSVTESVTQCDLAKCPPLSSHPSPAFLNPHSLKTCNFATLSENCSLTVSEYYVGCCDFKVQSSWGFPGKHSPRLIHPRFVICWESAGHGDTG